MTTTNDEEEFEAWFNKSFFETCHGLQRKSARVAYMAALKAERERSSVLVEALVEIEKIQTELYHYKSSSLMVAEKALKECENERR